MDKKKSDVKTIDNLELHYDKGYVVVSVNPKVYPIGAVHSAAYVFMEDSFVVLDGDPEKKITVKLRPKEKNKNLEELGRGFNDELLNYAVYNTQSEKNRVVKEAIVQKALFTNQGEECKECAETEEESYIDDPLGIAIPWEENPKKNKVKVKSKKE
jgi:His-Xaa-Ser system protein HxsD